MITGDTYDPISPILDVHKMVSGFILQAVEDIPESRMTEQPGTLVNHPAWTLSHLNAYAGVLLSMFDDPSVPTADAEMEQFGYGTIPVTDPALYAPKQELIDQFRDRNERLAAVVAQKHATYFPRPAPEKFQPYSPTIGHIALTLLVAHPADHFGQLRLWRRVAGIVDRE
ncbi:MAG: DinB family protein [Phycisphaerales bacterium]